MIRIEYDCGNYTAYATEFTLADDMYLFFEFKSPKSGCEIGIAYDEFVNDGDWFISNGTLDVQDREIVNDVVFDLLPEQNEFHLVTFVIDSAIRKFNEMQRHDL